MSEPGGPADAGSCYHENIRTRYTPVAEDPLPGRAFTFLVGARFAGGVDGSLGRTSEGDPRVPAQVCP